jgi:hypothetical protein
MKKLALTASVLLVLLCLAEAGFIASIAFPSPDLSPPAAPATAFTPREGDAELAYLLVKLELSTRAVIASHYTRPQSWFPGADFIYKRWLAKNAILPAAVADRIFSSVVPGATGGRAWVKMVVLEPRNAHNQGDAVALEMLEEIRQGAPRSERTDADAVYYGEPIITTETCLPCHGSPRGEPDPLFPQYRKDGWAVGEVAGAVIARVAPRKR